LKKLQAYFNISGIIIHEMAILTGEIGHVELERAKTQLKSMLLMNLESRPVIFEDLARQVLAQGFRQRPEHYIEKIMNIQKEDINRIAKKMLTR
jgi:processing peptidase subunit alpha